MTWIDYAAWGLFGGFAVEGLEFSAAIRRAGTWPWRKTGEVGAAPLAVSVVIRLATGAGLAVAAGTAGQVSGPFGALAVGVAAPLLVEQLARQVPVTASGTAPTVAGAGRPAVPPPPHDNIADTGSADAN